MTQAALAEVPKHELVQRLERARNTLQSYKKDAQRVGKLGLNLTLAAAGGAASGVLSIKHPKLFGSEIDTDAAITLVIAAGCAADMFDGADEYMASFAMGMAGAVAARETAQLMAARG
jgi:hypothetical protein